MNRHPSYLLITIFCTFTLLLAGCQTAPIYSPPKPQIAQTAPDTIQTPQAQSAANTQAKKELPSVKIALLLPLSGKYESLGQSMLKAAQMALFDLGHTNFELMPRDTQGRPDIARDAAQDALNKGAQLILGPVFGEAAKEVRPVAQTYGVNMISFSTDWTVAGRNSFIMGFSPFDQVNRIVEYSAQRGLTDFGLIIPNSAYGEAVRSAFRTSASRNHINTIKSVNITPGNSSVTSDLRSFSDYDKRQALKEQGTTVIGNSHAYTNPEPDFPFEAIFMPLGGQTARSISNLLNQYDMLPNKVRRIGTGLWDDTTLAAEPAMNGAWFASPNPNASQKFRDKFASIYGYEPPRLTTLAYDATALAGVLARKGFAQGDTPAFDAVSITNPNGFAGIDGIFRFNSNGVVERGLAVLEFRGGTIRVIDAAPKTFIKPQTYQPVSSSGISNYQRSNSNGQSYKF